MHRIQPFNFHCFNPIFLFMTILWCSSSPSPSISNTTSQENPFADLPKKCPTCGHHQLDYYQEHKGVGGVQELPTGLPAGVKFDPTDQEILEHLEGKVRFDIRNHRHHPRIDEFIHTIEGENGICYTHPEKLPGVNKHGMIRHFFHRPAKAYPTGTRKRRKVHTDEDGSETRWHKTGKTRPIIVDGEVKGYKKILVLYINFRQLKKSEKTNWVMHQYHLGNNEEEKDGELVVSKVFYQKQPRNTAPSSSSSVNKDSLLIPSNLEGGQGVTSTLPISVDWSSQDRGNPSQSHRELNHVQALITGSCMCTRS